MFLHFLAFYHPMLPLFLLSLPVLHPTNSKQLFFGTSPLRRFLFVNLLLQCRSLSNNSSILNIKMSQCALFILTVFFPPEFSLDLGSGLGWVNLNQLEFDPAPVWPGPNSVYPYLTWKIGSVIHNLIINQMHAWVNPVSLNVSGLGWFWFGVRQKESESEDVERWRSW